jgi:2-phospho-L-lactate transferase
MLGAGYPLSAVTEALCARWGLRDQGVRLLPMSDDRVETHVVVDDGEGGRRAIHFQEYWVRLRAEPVAHAVLPVGADDAKPAPGVLEAIAGADVVVLPPSNPVVSVGTILAVPGIREAVRATAAPVVGLSPIVSGAPVRGMADKVLAAVGVQTSGSRRRPALRRPLGRRAARRLARRRERRRSGRRGDRGGHRLPCGTAADDRRARHRRHGARGARARRDARP